MDVKDVIKIWELIKGKTQYEGGYGNITYLDLENAIDYAVGVEGKDRHLVPDPNVYHGFKLRSQI
jgi:hypothetical protein